MGFRIRERFNNGENFMAVTANRQGNNLTIAFSGSFNFHARSGFVESYKNQPADLTYELDFRKCPSVDSSALGMLMIFREHAGGESSNITITNCSSQLLNLFKVAQFHTIFDIK
jgi:HptB-dependent secretion and biofilm anti anti-sigma factor